MTEIRSHRDLVVWQKAMLLVERTYTATATFPDRERFALTQQISRAVISVPANLAEGHGRGTLRDYTNFVVISRGSLMEVDTLLEIAARLRYLSESDHGALQDLVDEVGRMLNGLLTRLRSRLAMAPPKT